MNRSDDIAISVTGISKSFKLPHEKHTSVKGALIGIFNSNRSYEKQQVLRNISFDIKKGEFFGIVGRNGSGKSTLLKLLAGIYEPDSGHIQVNGKLTPFIELGVGFNPNLTGRENVYLNGALLGFDRQEMNEMYDEIVEFAELDKFMDQKLKNYSSGMQVRLAFSIAIRAKSEILLLDEVLAVGDALFQKKCYDYFKQLKREKRTVVFVSHDSGALLEYCDRGILLEQGNIVYEGDIKRVVNDYIDILNDKEEHEVAKSHQSNRWGTGDAEVIKTTISDGSNKAKKVYTENDKTISITVSYKAKAPLEEPVYGITIQDAGGQRIITTNTMWDKVKTKNMKSDQLVKVTWKIPNIFNSGTFTVSPAIADRTGATTFDWLEGAADFKIRKSIQSIAFTNPDHELTIV